MVDAIGTGAVALPDPRVAATRATPVGQTAPAAPAAPVATSKDPTPPSAAPQIAALAKAMASSAPVDTDRVAEIKQALANGTFPILPATIADQMMALRYDWVSRD